MDSGVSPCTASANPRNPPRYQMEGRAPAHRKWVIELVKALQARGPFWQIPR